MGPYTCSQFGCAGQCHATYEHREISLSFPNVDHFGLVCHDGSVFPDGIHSGEDELDSAVSEGLSAHGNGNELTFSSYSCITSAAMMSLSLTNIWKALVKVDIFEAGFCQNHGT